MFVQSFSIAPDALCPIAVNPMAVRNKDVDVFTANKVSADRRLVLFWITAKNSSSFCISAIFVCLVPHILKKVKILSLFPLSPLEQCWSAVLVIQGQKVFKWKELKNWDTLHTEVGLFAIPKM